MKSSAGQFRFPALGIFIIYLFSFVNLLAQYPQFEWAKGAGGIGRDSANDIAVDKNGNCVIIGHFENSIEFGSNALTSKGDKDVFIAKYDPFGNIIWANQISGDVADYGTGIACDSENSVIVTGDYQSMVRFGSVPLVANGYRDVFIAKYDSSGNLLWAKTAGGPSWDAGHDIIIDSFDNIYITGFFSGRAYFDSVAIKAYGDAKLFMFIAAYDRSGKIRWVKYADGSDNSQGTGIAKDYSGNIYVTGAFSDSMFIENRKLVSTGIKDIFIVKYDSIGNLLWAKQSGGEGYDWAWKVAADKEGNCLITGQFADTAFFDDIALTSAGGYDIFIAKYNPDGQIIWAKSAGGLYNDQGRNIITDTFGNFYVTGEFIRDGTFDGKPLTGEGSIFIVKYDVLDNILWAKRGGGSYSWGLDIHESAQCCFIAGLFWSNTATFNGDTLHNAGESDIFVARLLEQPPPQLAVTPGRLDFGTDNDSLSVEIKNMGAGALAWEIIENPHQPWIAAIEPGSGINDTIVTVSVNRHQLVNSVDSTMLVISSNGGNQIVSLHIARPADNVPLHWQFTAATGNNATVILPTNANPDIEGMPLADGDYVGVFNSSGLCCGYSCWQGQNLAITVWGDDDQTPQIDGLIIGERLHYRVYQPDEQKEWNCVQVYYENNIAGQYSPDAIMILSQFSAMVGFNISGALQYYSNHSPIARTTMLLDGYQTITDSVGLFSFTAVPGGNFALTSSKHGDRGSSISAYDASLILRYVVGMASLTPFQMIAADVSGNGSISALDASYVLRCVVGLIDQFPVVDDWTFVPTNFAIDSSNWNTAPDSIAYTPLKSDHINQNFYGIIYGDVSGNWTPPGQRLAYKRDTLSGTATIKWGELENLPGDRFTMPVMVDLSGEFLAAEFTVLFNSQIVQFKAIDFCEAIKDFQKEYLLQPGKLTVAVAGGHLINSIDELARLEFQTLAGKNSSPITIELSEIRLDEAMRAGNGIARQIFINAAPPATFALQQNFPNPFNVGTTINYQLAQPAVVTLTVYDLSGQQVRRLIHATRSAGHHAEPWDGRDESGRLVASGIYFYRIEVRTDGPPGRFVVDSKKMILMK